MASISIVGTSVITYSHQWKSLYSDQWTSDLLPRQLSVDTIGMKDHGASIGLPDQWQLHPNIWVVMTEIIQRWLFDVLCLSSGLSGTEAKDQWRQYLDDGRCFNNRKGTDTHRDYISGNNLTADLMEFEPLICGGNIIEIIGEPKYFKKNYCNVTANYLHYPIRGIDPDNLPPVSDFLKDKAVCHTPTTIKPTGEHGIFPQFNSKAVYPIWQNCWVWDRLIR